MEEDPGGDFLQCAEEEREAEWLVWKGLQPVASQPAAARPGTTLEEAAVANLPPLAANSYTAAQLVAACWTDDLRGAVSQAAYSFIVGEFRPIANDMGFSCCSGYERALYYVARLANEMSGRSIRACRAELLSHHDIVQQCRSRWTYWQRNQASY